MSDEEDDNILVETEDFLSGYDGEKTYKFGVFSNGSWRKTFEKTLENFLESKK